MTYVELHLDLSEGDGPAPVRLAAAVVDCIAADAAMEGDALPPTRALAAQLGVSRGIVVQAYDELAAAGYVASRPGAGTFVAPGANRAARAARATTSTPTITAEPDMPGSGGCWDLRPGHPDATLIPARDWRAAWRAAARTTPSCEPLSTQGHRELRHALAQHLRRSRAITVDPADILITPGTAASLTILATAAELQARSVVVEDPGYQGAWHALSNAHVVLRHVPVGRDGLDPECLTPQDAAAYVTPAHQYPLGGRLPIPTRLRLLEFASRTGTLLVEDDYDGEFRYNVAPLPALRALPGAQDHVAYLGTASKILTPDLSLAWLITPPDLTLAARQAQQRLSLGAPTPAGLALAHLISSGSLARHVARASRTYRARRDALTQALNSYLPTLRPLGDEAGLHLVLPLPPGADEQAISQRALRAGADVQPLAYCRHHPGPPGLVLGYARLPETHADSAVKAITDSIAHE